MINDLMFKTQLSLEECQEVLDIIESSGMLPPARGLTYEDLNAMRIVMPSNEQFRYYHTWDKE